MSTIDSLEDNLIAKLKADANLDITIEKYPSNIKEYILIDPVGAVLIAYPGSYFENFGTPGELRIADVVFTFLLRNLREHEESYNNMEKVLDTLRGFAPDGFGQMIVAREIFIKEDGGVWQYDMPAKCTALIDSSKSGC